MDHQIASLSNDELLAATRDLVRRSCSMEADLLVHLGEIDERKLYLDRAFSSMFTFCTRELGFSEGAAYNRILVARAARRLPTLIEAVRSGRVHLAGLRLLAPHLTQKNHERLLAKAARRTKDEIAEIVAAMAPRAPSTTIRKLPGRPAAQSLPLIPKPGSPPPRPIVPVAEALYKLQFSISREFRDEIREAQDLLRHRITDGDLATIFRAALEMLVAKIRKERFAVVRKPRGPAETSVETESRHVPDAIKRAVYERDGGRCAFVDERGKRCDERGALEIDHIDGFARTQRHELDALRLLCRAHNQHAAERMYGRAFMESARQRACPGTSSG
jgi:5-methylcytosine-specific restriction endonuclease McrA